MNPDEIDNTVISGIDLESVSPFRPPVNQEVISWAIVDGTNELCSVAHSRRTAGIILNALDDLNIPYSLDFSPAQQGSGDDIAAQPEYMFNIQLAAVPVLDNATQREQ